jgi:hypothetical protein
MKRFYSLCILGLITTLFSAQSTNGNANNTASSSCSCNVNVYNQTANKKLTGKIVYYNTCETKKVAVVYKVYNSNWTNPYRTASYATLSYTQKAKPISTWSPRENGSKLELLEWYDCEEYDCEKIIKRYKDK